MIERVKRVARLDWTVFGEVEFDYEASEQAGVIVAVTSALSALAAAIATGRFIFTLFGVFVAGMVHWVVWGYVGAVLARRLHALVDSDNTLRVFGYALVPRILSVLTIIPGIGWVGALVGELLALLIGIKGADDGLELSTSQALVVAGLSWLVAMIVTGIIGFVFRGRIFVFNHLWT